MKPPSVPIRILALVGVLAVEGFNLNYHARSKLWYNCVDTTRALAFEKDRDIGMPRINAFRTGALASSPVALTFPLSPAGVNSAAVLGGGGLLLLYHLRLYLRERSGKRTWRSTQAETREQWAQHVRESEGWLYAIQTLRNAITAQTFLATTVLSLLTVIAGRLWEILRTLPSSNNRQAWMAQSLLFAGSMLTSAYHFLQSARLMTHAGFMFPVTPQTTKVDKIMRQSENSQWLGLRCLYLSAGMLSLIVGGPKAFFLASLILSFFFQSIDRVPEALEDELVYEI